MILNIGCGRGKLPEGTDGLDIVNFGQKYVLDIAENGLKCIEDETYDHIIAHNVFEHIPNKDELSVMNECWRVLKKGGTLHIIVPKYGSEAAAADPTHLNTHWVREKFTGYYAGKRPRNAEYLDRWGTPMRKWGICNDGKGNYLIGETKKTLDIKLYKS